MKPFTVLVPCSTANLGAGFDAVGIALSGPDLMVRTTPGGEGLRIVKLSGEALMGDLDYGTDPEQIERIANQVREVRVQEVEVAIVVGAGNIYRGIEAGLANLCARYGEDAVFIGPARAQATGRAPRYGHAGSRQRATFHRVGGARAHTALKSNC